MNVITKIAITIVPRSDCIELITSLPKLLTTRRWTAGADSGAGEKSGCSCGKLSSGDTTTGVGSGWLGVTIGWFEKSMKSNYLMCAIPGPLLFLLRFWVETLRTSTLVARHLAPQSS